MDSAGVSYDELMESSMSLGFVEDAFRKHRAMLVEAYKRRASSSTDCEWLSAKAKYCGFARGLKQEMAAFDALVMRLDGDGMSIEDEDNESDELQSEPSIAMESQREDMSQGPVPMQLSSASHYVQETQIDTQSEQEEEEEEDEPATLAMDAMDQMARRESVEVVDEEKKSELVLETETEPVNVAEAVPEPQSEPVVVAEAESKSEPEPETESETKPKSEEWPTLSSDSHSQSQPAGVQKAQRFKVSAKSVLSRKSNRRTQQRKRSPMAAKTRSVFKYSGKGFDVFKGRPIYSASTLYCSETCNGNEQEMRDYLVSFGGFNARKILSIEFKYGYSSNYSLVRVRGPIDSVQQRVQALNRAKKGPFGRGVMHIYQRRTAVSFKNASSTLYVTGFDILNQRTHRKMTELFLRYGALAKHIEIGVSGKSRDPFAIVEFSSVEHAKGCYMASRQNEAEFVFDRKLLMVDFSKFKQ